MAKNVTNLPNLIYLQNASTWVKSFHTLVGMNVIVIWGF